MASFAYGSGREPVAVSLLDEKGQAAVTTRISRDAAGRPVAIDDGRGKREVSYNRFGYPIEIKDVFGNVTKLCYNIFNVPVKTTDANGLVTEYSYNADGLVTSVVRRDGAETLASVEVAYDESARPVSVRDQDGRVTAFDRDEFGRVLKEKFADGSEVAYTYDAFGRRTSVLDENGHRISFGWNRFGLSSRTTRYEYDAAGRLVREGDRTYTYGYLDKVTSVRDGANTYTYHPDGQLATADYGRARTPAAPQGEDSPSLETFTWDGLALIQRGNEHFINEPHIGGGNPVVSSKGASYFNDMLGTTVGAKSGKTYSAATLSAFGETIENGSVRSTPTPSTYTLFYTGKPQVAGLGHAFLMRNYRASLGKWQTADPMGYPDGWNQLAYCGNGVTGSVDLWGAFTTDYEVIQSTNAEADKVAGEYIRDGISPVYRCDNTLRYYVNETSETKESYVYFATGYSVTTTTNYYADVYELGYYMVKLTKNQALKRFQNVSYEVIKGMLSIVGNVISALEAAGDVTLMDMLNAIEGNEVPVRIHDAYKCLGKHQLIKQEVSIVWYWE